MTSGGFHGAIFPSGPGGDGLLDVAREFSPRVARCPGGEVVMDLGGLTRLFGDRRAIAEEVRRTAADRGAGVRVAIADGRTTVRVLVHHRPGISVVAPGEDAAALAPVPVRGLAMLCAPAARDEQVAPLIRTLRQWGLTTLGAFAALPPDEVAARLGQDGVRWQRLAAGHDADPLVPAAPDERFERAIDLEWPIEGLEPLSFVLGRLLEPLSAHLERRDRAASVVRVRLHLVTRALHERTLQLPVPMREARALRTLLLLDLESHPPAAAIDRVVVGVDPTPGRIVQFSVLSRPLPSPEQLSTLVARLQALMGDSRCGAPAVVDTWEPGAYAMTPFAPVDPPRSPVRSRPGEPALVDGAGAPPPMALRRFRLPVVARVHVEDGRPAHVRIERRGLAAGRVMTCAGPWRTSGGWWTLRPSDLPTLGPSGASGGWDRDEWDVTLADRVTYRVFRDRGSAAWFVEGIVD